MGGNRVNGTATRRYEFSAPVGGASYSKVTDPTLYDRNNLLVWLTLLTL